jgi:hypothetical protein
MTVNNPIQKTTEADVLAIILVALLLFFKFNKIKDNPARKKASAGFGFIGTGLIPNVFIALISNCQPAIIRKPATAIIMPAAKAIIE